MSIQALEDYFNGNLTDAKERAKHHSANKLLNALVEDYGKTNKAAVAIVDYLKFGGSFQAACDAEGLQ